MLRAVTNGNVKEKQEMMKLSVGDVFREIQLFILDAKEQKKAFDKLQNK